MYRDNILPQPGSASNLKNQNRVISLFFITLMIFTSLAGLLLFSFETGVDAATISISGTKPITNEIITGNYTFEVNDAGDATSCELRIDGSLIATMDDTGGSNPDWNYSFNTSGYSDGSHLIRFDSIGGASGTDIISIPVKFDNNGPTVSNVTTLYPKGQIYAKPGDIISVIAKVQEPVSSIASVTCDVTMIGGTSAQQMYDDGLHNDGSPNDDTYGTAPITINVTGGYWAVYVHAKDTQGNFRNVTGAANVDVYEPTILEIQTMLPAGQDAVKNADQFRVTAKALDYKIIISDKVDRKPLDVVLVLDNSGSMAWSNGSGGMKWNDLEFASTTFIDKLAENDRCSIISFNAQGNRESVKQYSRFLTMSETYNDPQGGSYTSTGRNVSKYIITVDDGAHLTNIWGQPNCWTPIWDSIGSAIQYALNNRRTDAVPVVIAMTDGDDAGSHWPYSNEYGSETYCPGALKGATGQTWSVSGGCIWNSPDRTYPSVQREDNDDSLDGVKTFTFGPSAPERTRTGLLNASIPVFTIGLGIIPQGSNSSVSDYMPVTNSTYPYTTEFDLRNIANTSLNGRYYYAPNPQELNSIYTNVSEVIQQYGVKTLGLEHPNGINSVQADFSSIGISLMVNMFDDGMHGDGKNGDEIYGSELISVNSLDSGNIVFQVIGTDEAGNQNGTQFTILLDNTQPAVSTVNTSYPPGRDKAQDGYSIFVYANCSDGQTGLGNVYLDASNIGGPTQIPMLDDGTGNDDRAYDGIYTSSNVTIATGLKSGIFTYTVNAYDKAGNLGSQSGNIIIYNDVDINMANLLENNVISGYYQIIANITDPDGIPDTATNPKYRIDSNPWFNMLLLSGTEFHATINTSQYLDGKHTLYVNARDNFGAESTLETEFIIDNTPPSQVTVITPIADEYIEGVYSFKCTAVDAIGIRNVTITIINETGYDKVANATMGYNSGTGYYEYVLGTTAFTDGKYNVTVFAHDYGGHETTSKDLAINIDNNDPAITLNHPKNADFVYGMVQMNMNVIDAFLDIVEYNVDDSGWVNQSTPWNTSKVDDGSHSITVRAKDKAGHEVLITIVVTVDNHFPVCILSQPGKFQYIGGIYTLRAHVSDQVGINSVNIKVNHVVDINSTNSSITEVINTTMGYNAGTGYYEYILDTITLSDGNYTINVTGKDTAGNVTATGNITFYIDNNAPDLSIAEPYEGKIVSGSVLINTIINETFLDWVKYNVDNSGWVNISIPWDTTKLQDGTHTINLRVKDKAAHYTEESINVVVDNFNPLCNIVAPIPNQYIEKTFKFKIAASDLVQIDRVTISVFGETVNTTFNTESSCYELSVDTTVYSDGSRYVSATAYDKSGKAITSIPVQFHVDNHIPVLTLNSPIDGQYVNDEVLFDVSVVELFPDAIEYDIDGKGWTSVNIPWNTTQLKDGEHTVKVRVHDKLGHETIQTITVIIDNHDPVCIIQAPIDNQYIEETFTFKILATDAVGIEKVDLSVFYKQINAVYNVQTGYYEYTIDTKILEDGEYNISAFCSDRANRSVFAEPIDFRVDNTEPDLKVNAPLNGIFVTGEVEIDLKISDAFPSLTEYNVDGNGWIPYFINPIWNSTTVPDGEHYLEFRSIDPAGHMAEHRITLFVDNFAPSCALHSPAEEQFIEGTFVFKVLSQDTVGMDYVSMTLFGKTVNATYNSQTNYFEYPIALSSKVDGRYNITITAHDKSGKSTTIGPIWFNVDNMAPILTINFPTSNEFVSGNILLDISVNDTFPTTTTYNVDGSGWVPVDTPWETEKGHDGEHTLAISTLDSAGHKTEQTITVNVDNSPPKVSLVLPKENDYIGGIYTVKVYAADTFGIQSVYLDIDGGEPQEISQNPSTGLFELPIDTTKLDLDDGEHILNIKAVDRVFHSTEMPINIYIDNSAPEINLKYPKIGKGQITFVLNATDLSGINSVIINIDGTGWREFSSYEDKNDTFRYIWRTDKSDNGYHIFDVKVIDKLGNEEIVSGSLEVENNAKDDPLKFLLDILPLIAFIVVILIVISVFIMFKRGTFNKWLGNGKGASVDKDKDEGEIEEEADLDETLDEDDEFDFEFARAGAGEDEDSAPPNNIDTKEFDWFEKEKPPSMIKGSTGKPKRRPLKRSVKSRKLRPKNRPKTRTRKLKSKTKKF